MKTKSIRDKYSDGLRNLPEPGGGGCHAALLGVANLGSIAGLTPEEVFNDLFARVQGYGSRRVTPGEIRSAVNKAFATDRTYSPSPAAAPSPAVNGVRLLEGILERGKDFTAAEIWESSPIRIDWPPVQDAAEVIQRLYQPTDKLFAGSRLVASPEFILTAAEWCDRFAHGDSIPEHIIPNPLTGEQGLRKDGQPSYRADDCVASFRFAVVEFDAMPLEQQIQFWAGVKLPVVALIDSGGKSVHGWVRVDAADRDQWERRVEGKLFTMLTAVGADRSCKNEARLSRMPGHFRTEKKRYQRLLYLNPTGGQVIP
jgi:hypothetical protein